MSLFDFLPGGSNAPGGSNDPAGSYLGNMIDPATAQQYDAARQQQGLMGLATGLLQSSGASRLPVTFGAAMGNGLAQMQQAQNSFQNQAQSAASTENTLWDSYYKQMQTRMEGAKFGVMQQLISNPPSYLKGSLAPPPTAGDTTTDNSNPYTTGPAGAPAPVTTTGSQAKYPTGGNPEAGSPDVNGGVHYAAGGAASVAPVVAKFESSNNPYVGYGGTDLSKAPLDDAGFPVWNGAKGPAGISHAAGLYGIEPATWHQYAPALGVTDFSPASRTKVFNAIYNDQGITPWNSNTKLMSTLSNQGLDTKNPQPGAMPAAPPGYTPDQVQEAQQRAYTLSMLGLPVDPITQKVSTCKRMLHSRCASPREGRTTGSD